MRGLVASGLGVRLGARTIMTGVDLGLRSGEVTAILGPNGVGKSTLLACLAGLRTPNAGTVALDGQALLSIPPRQRAQRLTLLPQSSEIAWPITVATLAGLGRIPHQGPFGPSRADEAAVERALTATGMSDFAGRAATSLSGGERARALIARALAGEPDWLLADEPLTGLDPGHALDALRLFRTEAGKGKGVVLTLHDLTLAARAADRIVVLHDGAIIADGAPLQALTPQVLARAYGVRAEVTQTPEGPRVDVLDRV